MKHVSSLSFFCARTALGRQRLKRTQIAQKKLPTRQLSTLRLHATNLALMKDLGMGRHKWNLRKL